MISSASIPFCEMPPSKGGKFCFIISHYIGKMLSHTHLSPSLHRVFALLPGITLHQTSTTSLPFDRQQGATCIQSYHGHHLVWSWCTNVLTVTRISDRFF
jgi:hypothetical protein